MDYFDEDDYAYEENAFLPAYDVFNRVGRLESDYVEERAAALFPAVPDIPEDDTTSASKETKKFLASIDATLKQLIDRGVIQGPTLSYHYARMRECAKRVTHPEFKNSTSFVLGYHVLNDQNTIDLKQLHRMTPLLSAQQSPYDVIRYADLFVHHLL